ncbi:hypothetical protein ACRAWF_21930 [Streptomyces sp. L7]
MAVTFTPTASGTRTGELDIASNASNGTTTVQLTGTGAGTVSRNPAAGAATTESSHSRRLRLVERDGRQPGHLLGERQQRVPAVGPGRPRFRPRARAASSSSSPRPGARRNQTADPVRCSTDGASFTTLKSSATYTFDPTTNNTVTITFTAATERYLRVNITANNGWPAGQGVRVPGLEHLT